jgi:hypothetical protein
MNIHGYSRRPVGHGRASLYVTLLVTAPSRIHSGVTACKDEPIDSTSYLLPTEYSMCLLLEQAPVRLSHKRNAHLPHLSRPREGLEEDA